MISTRRRTALLAVSAALVAGLASAAAANAAVICVPNDTIHPSCDVGQDQPTIQAGLAAAQASLGVDDTVRIGPGNFMVPQNQNYDESTGGVLQLMGSGRSVTTWTAANLAGSSHALDTNNWSGSSISDMAIDLTDDAQGTTDSGIQLDGGTVTRVDLNGPTVDNTQGIQVSGDSTIDDITISLQQPSPSGNQGITGGAEPVITDSTISVGTGFSRSGSNQTAVIRRSTFHSTGVGIEADSGSIDISDSLIDLMGANNATGIFPTNTNLGVNPIDAIVDHVTIVNGGANSRGVVTSADSDPFIGMMQDPNDMTVQGEMSTATVTNTLINGVAHPFVVEADRGERAGITVDFSNYDPAGNIVDNNISDANATGVVTLTETNSTNLAPAFAMDGYHLLPTSLLIDIGKPGLAPGQFDIDGEARVLDGTFDCTFMQRADIGADEYAGATQGMPASCNPILPTPAPTVTPTTATATPKKKCKKRKRRGAAAAKKCRKKRR